MPQESDTHSGALYPNNYVIAVIDNPQDAEKAVQTLRDAGYGSEDIRLFRGQELVEMLQEKEQKQGVMDRIASAFLRGSDDGDDLQKYVEEARKGHSVINVYERKSENANHIRDILAPFHAHTIKHFGTWTITNIQTPQ